MTQDMLTGLVVFSMVSSITPGPNNLMLMASGANFGFRLTVPHMAGVGIGFTLMIILVGIGLVQIFNAWPASYDLLRIVSVLYLLWLAWKIASSAGLEDSAEETGGKPLTFIQAALFQWVNPKAWTMALTALSAYSASTSFMSVLLVALVFGLINLPCVSLWTVLGQQIRLLLTSQRRLVAFNVTMAILLVGSLYPVLQSLPA